VPDRLEFGLGGGLLPVPSNVVDDLHARRAASFGPAAPEYALHRPDYPNEAVAWALALLPKDAPNGGPHRAPHVGRVLDLGAGTGKLTAAIVRCGVPTAAVLAVEPDDGMRAELSRQLPEIATLRGSAERIPAEDGAVHAVLVGQAFHWFDPDRALPEIARVLRPGGVLAAIGNTEDDSVGWVAELAAATQTVQSAVGIGLGFVDVPTHPAFGKLTQRRFRWCWPRTIDSLLATVSTHSWVLVSRSDERAAALAAIRRFLEQHPVTRDGAFELPMQTLVHQVTRRS
jgi:SAM-dependent methyltransferase